MCIKLPISLLIFVEPRTDPESSDKDKVLEVKPFNVAVFDVRALNGVALLVNNPIKFIAIHVILRLKH